MKDQLKQSIIDGNEAVARADKDGYTLGIMTAGQIIAAVMTKEVNPLWWLGLLVGILLIVLAFWTSQQLVTVTADLLLFYVGLMALFRGISQIVFAFALHSAAKNA